MAIKHMWNRISISWNFILIFSSTTIFLQKQMFLGRTELGTNDNSSKIIKNIHLWVWGKRKIPKVKWVKVFITTSFEKKKKNFNQNGKIKLEILHFAMKIFKRYLE